MVPRRRRRCSTPSTSRSWSQGGRSCPSGSALAVPVLPAPADRPRLSLGPVTGSDTSRPPREPEPANARTWADGSATCYVAMRFAGDQRDVRCRTASALNGMYRGDPTRHRGRAIARGRLRLPGRHGELPGHRPCPCLVRAGRADARRAPRFVRPPARRKTARSTWEVVEFERPSRIRVAVKGSGYEMDEIATLSAVGSGTRVGFVDAVRPTTLAGRVMVALSGGSAARPRPASAPADSRTRGSRGQLRG